jgi:hypothetical protein
MRIVATSFLMLTLCALSLYGGRAGAQGMPGEAEIVADPALQQAVMDHYNQNIRTIRFHAGQSSPSRMIEISDVTVREIAGNRVTIDIHYRWEATDYTFYNKSDDATVTLDWAGGSYSVIAFE